MKPPYSKQRARITRTFFISKMAIDYQHHFGNVFRYSTHSGPIARVCGRVWNDVRRMGLAEGNARPEIKRVSNIRTFRYRSFNVPDGACTVLVYPPEFSII